VREEIKVIAVSDNIANITNGSVLIRRPLNVPSGFYYPGRYDDVVTAPHPEAGYPDVKGLRPDFNNLQYLGTIDRNCIATMVKACQEAMEGSTEDEHGNTEVLGVTLEDNVIYSNKKQRYPTPLKDFPYKVVVNPLYLDIVLKEMLNYPSSKVLVEKARSKPLVFGQNWNQCALIMPCKV